MLLSPEYRIHLSPLSPSTALVPATIISHLDWLRISFMVSCLFLVWSKKKTQKEPGHVVSFLTIFKGTPASLGQSCLWWNSRRRALTGDGISCFSCHCCRGRSLLIFMRGNIAGKQAFGWEKKCCKTIQTTCVAVCTALQKLQAVGVSAFSCAHAVRLTREASCLCSRGVHNPDQLHT